MATVLDNERDERLDIQLAEEQLLAAITAMSLAFQKEENWLVENAAVGFHFRYPDGRLLATFYELITRLIVNDNTITDSIRGQFQEKYRELINAFCTKYNDAAKLCYRKVVKRLCSQMTLAFREIDRTVEGPAAWIAEADSIISSAMLKAEQKTQNWTVDNNHKISYLQPLLDHGAFHKRKMLLPRVVNFRALEKAKKDFKEMVIIRREIRVEELRQQGIARRAERARLLALGENIQTDIASTSSAETRIIR